MKEAPGRIKTLPNQHNGGYGIALTEAEYGWATFINVFEEKLDTVKPVYNDHLIGYFSAFWG